MDKKTETLHYKKSTKNTFVYMSEQADPVVPSLYIRRHFMPDNPPQIVELTIAIKDQR